MALKLGTTDISAVYLGTTAVQKVCLGSTQVWPKPAVAFDAVGAGFNGSASGGSFAHTATTGAAVLLYLEYAGTVTVSSVTYAGSAMTLLGSGGNIHAYGITNVPGSAQTIAITSSGFGNLIGNSESYLNVSSFGSPATNTGSSASMSVSASSDTNHMVSQSFCWGSSRTVSSYNQTQRGSTVGTTNPVLVGDAAGAATVNFSASLNGSTAWYAIAVDVIP